MSDSPPIPAAAAAVVLQIAGRPGPAFRLDATHENVLGRASGSLVTLADRLASRQHAEIRFDAEASAWIVRDLGSRNGTWLDGVRISSAPLVPGGQIRIGTTALVFVTVAAGDEPPSEAPTAHRVVRRGPAAELEGAALARAAGGDESRWSMLLYQASIRLLAAGSRQDVVCTTLELAAEFTAAARFAWLQPGDDGGPVPICVVPPGSNLAARVASLAWTEATQGRAIWLADESPGEGDLACIPLTDGGRVLAVLAAGGSIRDIDFDLFLALASLAAAATARRDRQADPSPADPAAQAATTDPLEEDALATDEDSPAEGTLALSAAELDLLRGGQLNDWLATAGTLRLEDWERMLLVEALRRTGGGVPEAAALLGMSRATLYRRLDAYGFTRPGSRPAPS